MPMKDSDIEIFVAGAAVRTTAEITGVNRNTVRVFFQRLRKLIASTLPCYELSGGWIVFFPQPCIVLSSRAIVEAGRVRGTGSLCRFVCYLRLSKRGLVNQNN
jgi:hypothetical protein